MKSLLDKGEWIKGVAHWTDGPTAFISVAFTWRVLEARDLALSYRDRGFRVRAGGPALFTCGKLIADVAELGGAMPDAIARHNPRSTRASYGCPVDCWFCIVPKMNPDGSKGDGTKFTLVPDFPVRPILCDDNLSALPADYQEHIVRRYRESGVPLLDANSGFEPKTFTREVYERWKPVLRGPWRFGFDEKGEWSEVERTFKILHDDGVRPKRIQVYTMIGHEPFAECMERIRRVIALGGEPYAQPFLKLNALDRKPPIRFDWAPEACMCREPCEDVKECPGKLRAVQRWVNRHLWRKTRFEDYRPSVKTKKSDPRQGVMFT